MIIRTATQRADLLEAGRRLGAVLEALETYVAPGMSVEELDTLAEKLIRDGGDEPAFLGYTPGGANRAYPATLCVSVNEEVVHGIPTENPRTLLAGDIVSLDLGLTHNGIIVDSAITVAVGKTDENSEKLMRATKAALYTGIAAARVGGRVGDISHAIEQSLAKTGFSVVEILGGHAVGDAVHEEPFIPNVGHKGTGEELEEGLVLALEPIANAGRSAVVLAPDGYTFLTKDGKRSAHFEHTILIEKGGTTIVTRRPSEKF